jgi:hypothetical protein
MGRARKTTHRVHYSVGPQYRPLAAGTNKTVSLLVELLVFTDDQADFPDCATMTRHPEVETGSPLNHAPSLQATRHTRQRMVPARPPGHTTSVRFASARMSCSARKRGASDMEELWQLGSRRGLLM